MSEQTFTVSELADVIGGALKQAMPYGVWVEGGIQGLNHSRRGHVYFDLIEPAETPGQAPVASISVVLFRGNYDRVKRLLKRHGDPIHMTDGVRIRIQGTAEFYPPNGRLQLKMSSIDPTYTLGVLAAEREALLHELAESGLRRANAAYSIPEVPTRIGIVTSLSSAAHADITTVFENSAKAFTLVEVDTPVQGQGAENHIAAAIATVGTADVDIIIVARGGGSKTDLAVFDRSLVAYAIAHAAAPVFTGIGHDTDRSVADEVAHSAHATPTAAAQAVVARVDEWLGRLAAHEAEIAYRTRRTVTSADQRVEALRTRVGRASSRAILRANATLSQNSERLRRGVQRAETSALSHLDRTAARLDPAQRRVLRYAERRVDAAADHVRALDPALALARGWSITRDAHGRVVRTVAGHAVGDTVTTQVADGVFTSTISATNQAGASSDE